MRSDILGKVLSILPAKRIKFQNGAGWGRDTMGIDVIIEQGNVYILMWCCHPKCLRDDLKENQKLIWYNPLSPNYELVNQYFPDYYDKFK